MQGIIIDENINYYIYAVIGRNKFRAVDDYFDNRGNISTFQFTYKKLIQVEDCAAYKFGYNRKYKIFPASLRAVLANDIGLDEYFDFELSFDRRLLPKTSWWICDECDGRIIAPEHGFLVNYHSKNRKRVLRSCLYHNVSEGKFSCTGKPMRKLPNSYTTNDSIHYMLTNGTIAFIMAHIHMSNISLDAVKRLYIPGYEMLRSKKPKSDNLKYWPTEVMIVKDLCKKSKTNAMFDNLIGWN